MQSLDKHYVSAPDQSVYCALRDRRVELPTCLDCRWLVRTGEAERGHYVVCDVYKVIGFLGMDTP